MPGMTGSRSYVVIENESSVSSVDHSVVYTNGEEGVVTREEIEGTRKSWRQNGRTTTPNLDLLKAAFSVFGQTAGHDATDASSYNAPEISLSFADLSYSVKQGIRRETKCILNNLHGEFRSGELTAVMGPSGAGKSSLLNILAGFTTHGVTGSVHTNGTERDLRTFARQSCTIFQDDELHPLLTVHEAMTVAAHLKLGPSVRGKRDRVNKLLQSLGLYQSRRVLTGKLSGGQKKRLAIALEMVSNPPVMFFDEPTSGLDSSTSKQCIEFLKMLARSGRTVICTIHQPSASLFEMFDHVYTVHEGNCIYSGDTKGLVPYLAEQGLHCPQYHNPADFLLEVASMTIYAKEVPKLVRAMDRGRVVFWRKKPTSNTKLPEESCPPSPLPNGKLPVEKNTPETYCNGRLKSAPEEKPQANGKLHKPGVNANGQAKSTSHQASSPISCYPTSFFSQLVVIMSRRLRTLYRDRFFTYLKIGMHVLVGLLLGVLLYDTGGDAAYVFKTFGLMFFSVMFTMFTNYSSTFSMFGEILPILTREHFNKWYSLKSFFLATDLVETPLQFICTFVYTIIMYFMTAQPLEAYRFFMTLLILLLNGFIAQGMGYIVGSATRVQDGPILGPLLIAPFIVFSGFFVLVEDSPFSLRWLFHISYFKYALEGLMIVIYGRNRQRLSCSEDYCHFVIPSKFLQQIGMSGMAEGQVWFDVAILFVFGVVLRIISYFCLSFRIQHIKK